VVGGASGDAAGIFDDEPDVHAHRRAGFLAHREHRVPVAGVDARQFQVGRDLAEAHGVRAAHRVAPDLFDGEVDVPERHEAEGNEVTVGVGAPLVDHPVVVRAHAREAELEVVAFEERLAAEARERGERERAVDAGKGEVVDARLRLVAAGAHLFVGDRAHEQLAAVEAPEVAVGSGVERDGHVPLVQVDEAVLVDPVVAPPPVVGDLLGVRRAGAEHDVAEACPLDARTLLAPLRGEPIVPEVRRFDDVVVDADDHR
jgi:hypothetical protein